ncbi:MAG TPA: hypothetical protein DCP08_03370 [Chloroflexi bacterium]|nr:hypothetical protein [Chloroflexota bacterium]
MSQASDFNSSGIAKEFMTDDGRTYLVMRFADRSGCVLRRRPGTGGATADYRPISAQKRVVERLGVPYGTTYQMISRLLAQQ